MFEYYNASPWLPLENIFSRTTLQRAHTYILGTSPNKLHSQKKHFSLFARVAHIPAKPDYPRQNCLLSKTYFKGSKYVYPTTVMGLINPRIKKKRKKIFNVLALSRFSFHVSSATYRVSVDDRPQPAEPLRANCPEKSQSPFFRGDCSFSASAVKSKLSYAWTVSLA